MVFSFFSIGIGHAQTRARDYPIAPLRIIERGGEVGFRADYFREIQRRDGEDEQDFKNLSTQEWVTYRLRGYIYHPRFVDIRTKLTVGLLQQAIDRSGVTERLDNGSNSNSFIGGYDVQVDLLKEHPVSLSFFASRDRSAVLEIFTDRQLIETERHGGVLNLKKGPLPMTFSLSRTRLREFGNDTFSDSIDTVFEYAVRHEIQDLMRTELRYRHRDFKQDFRANNRAVDIDRETDLRSQDVSLLNTLYLTRNRRNDLQSTLRWYDQRGSQEIQNLYWQERLTLRPAENLRNYYLLSLLNNQLRQARIKTWRAEAGIDHTLYQSLDTHFDVHGRRIDFEDAEERETGFTGRLGYRKNTPWGRLTAGYGITLDRVENIGQSAQRPIIDESVTLTANITEFLSQPAVISSTIVVTDATGFITYDEGLDYEIEVRGNRTGLRLILTGLITEGDTVLVDYEFATSQDIDYISDTQNFYVRHEFDRILDGLALYYRHERLKARGAPSDDDFRILEFTDKQTGFSLRWQDIVWSEEYEIYDSNFNAFRQLRSQIEGTHQLGRRIRAGWNLGALMTEFDEEMDLGAGQDKTDVLFAGLATNGPIRTNGNWRLEGRWRKETGRTESNLLGLIGRLAFRFRKVTVESGVRAEYNERFGNNRDRFQFFLQVSREF